MDRALLFPGSAPRATWALTCVAVLLAASPALASTGSALATRGSALAKVERAYEPGWQCNEFVAKALLEVFAADAIGKANLKEKMSIPDLITYAQTNPRWMWTARGAKPSELVSSLVAGDVVFMARDPDAAACDMPIEIPAKLEGGKGHHVAIVVGRDGDGVLMAESGDKQRKCLERIAGKSSSKEKGSRVVLYSRAFVENSVFGVARAK